MTDQCVDINAIFWRQEKHSEKKSYFDYLEKSIPVVTGLHRLCCAACLVAFSLPSPS